VFPASPTIRHEQYRCCPTQSTPTMIPTKHFPALQLTLFSLYPNTDIPDTLMAASPTKEISA
jgi:hypothetical protein